MNSGFWHKLKRPFLVMAPMADVTDAAFRRIIAKYSRHGEKDGLSAQVGGPDVFYTEFVSCDGLLSAGREKLLKDLAYTEGERPIVAQIFGATPAHFSRCAKLLVELGFDGIDINMGCPDRSVEKQGAGAALIKNAARAQEIIKAAKEGVAAAGSIIPVSVKTRIGYNSDVLEEWISALLETHPAIITVHARTRKEMSKVPARWDTVARAVSLRNKLKSDTLIVGNGDVTGIPDALGKAAETGADGVMMGRAVFGAPWLFDRKRVNDPPPLDERLRIMVEHTKLFEELLGDTKNFSVMKKHYKAYVTGFDGAKELRMRLMEAKDTGEVEVIVNNYLGTSSRFSNGL